MQKVPLSFNFDGVGYNGWLIPLEPGLSPKSFQVFLNGKFLGNIRQTEFGWHCDLDADQDLVDVVGRYVDRWYK